MSSALIIELIYHTFIIRVATILRERRILCFMWHTTNELEFIGRHFLSQAGQPFWNFGKENYLTAKKFDSARTSADLQLPTKITFKLRKSSARKLNEYKSQEKSYYAKLLIFIMRNSRLASSPTGNRASHKSKACKNFSFSLKNTQLQISAFNSLVWGEN